MQFCAVNGPICAITGDLDLSTSMYYVSRLKYLGGWSVCLLYHLVTVHFVVSLRANQSNLRNNFLCYTEQVIRIMNWYILVSQRVVLFALK